MEIKFLLLDHVLKIHQDQIQRYGGTPGIRDINSLKSALNTPSVTYDGQLLHATAYEMAAAYLFHVVKNHPFIDGNKRTGAVTAMTFLLINGHSLVVNNEDLVEITLLVVQNKLSKAELATNIKNWI